MLTVAPPSCHLVNLRNGFSEATTVAVPENFVQQADGKRAGADGGIADFQSIEDFFQLVGVLGAPVLFILGINRLLVADEIFKLAPGRCIAGEMAAQRMDEALLAHVLDDGFGRVVGSFVFVVLQEIFKDMAEHFGIDADLVIVGIIFVDGEMIVTEEVEQGGEERGGKIERIDAGKVPLKEAAIEIRNAVPRQVKKIAGALAIQGIEK